MQLKRRPSDMTSIHYEKTRAEARRVVKEARLHDEVQNLLSMVHKIAGKSTSVSPPVLKIDGINFTDKIDANELAKSTAEISSRAFYTTQCSIFWADQELY